jgi:hypothetical protein
VEHRLFSQISKNWAGMPLRSLEIMLCYIRGTRTETGLAVTAHLDEGFYKKSVKYSYNDVDQLSLKPHDQVFHGVSSVATAVCRSRW